MTAQIPFLTIVLFAYITSGTHLQPEAGVVIRGTVVTSVGKPAIHARVGSRWEFSDWYTLESSWTDPADRRECEMRPTIDILTDEKGEFKFTAPSQFVPRVLMITDNVLQEGAIIRVPRSRDAAPLWAQLDTMELVLFEVDSSALGVKRDTLSADFCTFDERLRFAQLVFCHLRSDHKLYFSVRLPPGSYEANFGTETSRSALLKLNLRKNAKASEPVLVKLLLSNWSQRIGKTPPSICATDALGTERDVNLEKLQGKWVIIEFWGHWCGPCVSLGLPELMKFFDDHQTDRAKYEILTIHCSKDVKTASEYRDRLKSIVIRTWKGRELPFPVLIDGEGCTAKRWGIESYPTMIVVDPTGLIRKPTTLKELEKEVFLFKENQRCQDEH